MKKPLIGFIGQGFIGGNMAADFEERGFEIIRYSLEPQHISNKERIADCDIVFVAVPTPTTPEGFDGSILKKVLPLVGKGKTAVIKSTVIPGFTQSVQKENPDIYILHSPEFLREVTAAEDTRHPERNLVGLPLEMPEYRERAERVLSILPPALYNEILLSVETEMVKYVGNNFLYTKVVFMNMMFDLSQKLGANWNKIAVAVSADSRIGNSHMLPVHASGHSDNAGRGAGGHCFPKDFEALLQEYASLMDDKKGVAVLEALRDKNNELLTTSHKDLDLLQEIYGANLKN